tara:strand:- start:538 stop:921 length:384 start_codon:yes stop_codon:yes gene_type:complete
MRLIDNFVELFHSCELPSPEKCFLLEEGDELYIKKWIKDGKINTTMKEIFEWLEKKYFSKNLNLEKKNKEKFDEIQRRFFIKRWRIILLMCTYQSKYRYYSKAINSIKNRSFSDMDNNDFFSLFEKN